MSSAVSLHVKGSVIYSFFSQYNAYVHWLIHGHITFNKQSVSHQMSMRGQHLQKRVTFFMSEGNSALFHASARNQTVTKGGMIMMQLMFTLSAWRIFQTALCCYITNHLMTDLALGSP